jgi:CRP/FNR family cyclic AMP-dependent transcriptional regulator
MSKTSMSEMTVDVIRSVPLFSSLDDGAANELCSLLKTREVPSGKTLFRAGDEGDAMYLIESGQVRITVTDEDDKEIVLAELARGDFFGEMAIVDGERRSADAAVIKAARLAVLSRDDFLGLAESNPSVALGMLKAAFSRLRSTDRLLQLRVSRNVNEEQEKRMTIADKAADYLAEFGGSWKFIGAFMLFLLLWCVANTWVLRNGFDAFPYVFLNLVLAVVASMQAPIIMMSQNRQQGKDRLRSDLDYQVNLKNELALTEVLRRLDVLESERLPRLFASQNEKIAGVVSPDPRASQVF